MRNGFIQGFDSQFHDGFLNEVLFSPPSDARTQIATGKKACNPDGPPFHPWQHPAGGVFHEDATGKTDSIPARVPPDPAAPCV